MTGDKLWLKADCDFLTETAQRRLCRFRQHHGQRTASARLNAPDTVRTFHSAQIYPLCLDLMLVWAQNAHTFLADRTKLSCIAQNQDPMAGGTNNGYLQRLSRREQLPSLLGMES
jgi:hypothetical protein